MHPRVVEFVPMNCFWKWLFWGGVQELFEDLSGVLFFLKSYLVALKGERDCAVWEQFELVAQGFWDYYLAFFAYCAYELNSYHIV